MCLRQAKRAALLCCLVSFFGCGSSDPAQPFDTLKSVAGRVRTAEEISVSGQSMEWVGPEPRTIDVEYEITDRTAIRELADILDVDVPLHCEADVIADVGEPSVTVLVYDKHSDSIPLVRIHTSSAGHVAVYVQDERRTGCFPTEDQKLSDLFGKLIIFGKLIKRDFAPTPRSETPHAAGPGASETADEPAK
jgi:hypothetical protein